MDDKQPIQRTLRPGKAATYIQQKTGHRPSPRTVARWMQEGKLQSIKIGRLRMTRMSWIEDFLRSTDQGLAGSSGSSSLEVERARLDALRPRPSTALVRIRSRHPSRPRRPA